ncbi:MAG: hypothetical protein ONB44_06800 [candidate division KSB1 bacterium]|nr:hypothetical protein [candidate division KSB1 bacterium]MDZ7301832.1 hypothetical protein [candidate division KSB1 bacterium]MDZ7310215.1 hypothetical protein [candidate division KSB1 bacterium]
MKTYAEFLRGYVGKKGDLVSSPASEFPQWVFVIKKSSANDGAAKLVDVGMDYAEFAVGNGFRFVPLNLLTLEVE